MITGQGSGRFAAAWFGKLGQNFDLPTSDAPAAASSGCTSGE
jgi:hypothetical protein